MNELIIKKEVYESLISVGQQVINSGANEEAVKSFIKELAPFYQKSLNDFKKQEIIIKETDLLATNERVKVELPAANEFAWWQDALINAALLVASPAYVALLNIARGISAASSVTIGLGPQATGGILVGLGASCGFCTYPNGSLGYYGSFSGLAGAIASISLTLQITIIVGGKENFSGWVWGAGIDGGDVIVGNAAALLSTDTRFLGITAGIGIGLGIPFEVFVTAQHAWAR